MIDWQRIKEANNYSIHTPEFDDAEVLQAISITWTVYDEYTGLTSDMTVRLVRDHVLDFRNGLMEEKAKCDDRSGVVDAKVTAFNQFLAEIQAVAQAAV